MAIVQALLGDDPAHQREAIGVEAGGGEAEDDVAGRHPCTVDHALALHRAYGKSGEVVVSWRVHPRHLGRLAADQRASGLAATRGDAGDDVPSCGDDELSGGEVVEKEERLRTLDDQVVDAHGDQIDTDAVMPVGGNGDLQFGADSIGGGNQDRIAIAGSLEVEQRAEPAQARGRATARRCRRQGLDGLDQGRARIDIDAGLAVAAGAILATAVAAGVYGVLRGDGI